MRINVTTVPNPDIAMGITLNTQQDQATLNYLQANYESFMAKAKQLNNEFVGAVKGVYNYFNNSGIVQKTKDILIRNGSNLSNDSIYILNSETVFNPGLLMKNYMMANPHIYNLYQENRCSGYEDEWHDNEKGTPAEWRNDYLYAIDGIGQWDDDNDELVITHYHGVDNPLSTRERLAINESWDTLNFMMANGIDPTDPNKGEL